jgi:hypothetical protein
MDYSKFYMKNKAVYQSIYKFVIALRHPEGGYSDALLVPPGLEDTYCALKTLKGLGKQDKSKATIDYIKNSAQAGYIRSFKLAYHLAILLQMYSIRLKPVEIYKPLLKSKPSSLTDWYYWFMLKKLIDGNIDIDNSLKSWLKKQTPQKLRYIDEVGRYVLLMQRLKLPFNKKLFIEWLQQMQNSDGGFGVLPYTTTFLEHVYISLRALKALRARPLDVDKCEEFVLSCITQKGGSGRQCVTKPTLEYTYYAFMSLEIISSWQTVKG